MEAMKHKPDGVTMDISIETITPDVARQMIASNTQNRPLSKSVCQRYASEMKDGKWMNDGAPIRFSHSGRLLDGQHRLNAVINSGTTIEAIVVRGLNDDSFQTMDTGKGRGGGDVLAIRGAKNANNTSAICSAYYYYQKSGHPGNKGGAEKITNAKIIDIYEKNPEISAAAELLRSSKWITSHLSSMALGVLYVAACKRGQKDKVVQFFRELANPTQETIGTAIMPLREKLIENKASKEKLSREMIAAYVFKAYRDWRGGRMTRKLKIVLRDGRLTRDHFDL